MGVLIGLWISVRNSEKQGIDRELAWNLGILVVLCGIVGAKILYIINDWSSYAAHPGEIFSFSTLQAGGVFSGGLVGFGTRDWARGMFRRRLLLWQTDACFLGSDVH